PTTFEELLRRSEIDCLDMMRRGIASEWYEGGCEAVVIEVKYAGYIERQKEVIKQAQRLENLVLPAEIEYDAVRGLSTEEREKLSKIRPRTLGQAQRISGVNPSAVQALLIHLKGKNRKFQ